MPITINKRYRHLVWVKEQFQKQKWSGKSWSYAQRKVFPRSQNKRDYNDNIIELGEQFVGSVSRYISKLLTWLSLNSRLSTRSANKGLFVIPFLNPQHYHRVATIGFISYCIDHRHCEPTQISTISKLRLLAFCFEIHFTYKYVNYSCIQSLWLWIDGLPLLCVAV